MPDTTSGLCYFPYTHSHLLKSKNAMDSFGIIYRYLRHFKAVLFGSNEADGEQVYHNNKPTDLLF